MMVRFGETFKVNIYNAPFILYFTANYVDFILTNRKKLTLKRRSSVILLISGLDK